MRLPPTTHPPLQARQLSATPGAGGTPGGAARGTPSFRSRLPSSRARLGARAGAHSEPSSPRGAPSGSLLGADSLADPLLDELLPPGEELAAPSPAAADTVRVYVRVRPPNEREAGAGAPACVSIQQQRAVVLAEAGRPEPYAATFDRVFAPEEGQGAVFEAVGAQAVEHCMAGERAGAGGAQGGAQALLGVHST